MNEVINKINSSKKILVVSHVRPDGDNIGSLSGFTAALALRGLNVTAANCDPVPHNFSFLPGSSNIIPLAQVKQKYDLLIVLDSSTVDRVGVSDLSLYSDFIINIDHHISNENYGNINLVFPEYSSTSQIVYEIIKTAKYKINSDIATCLYTGLMTDTVGFQTTSTNHDVFKMAAFLVKNGAKPNNICREIWQNKSLSNITILGKALSTLNFCNNGLICWNKIDQKMLRECKAQPSDVGGIINQMLSIKGVETAILFYEESADSVTIDLRSKSSFDVSKIATHFGGGGHLRASGATIKGALKNVITEVINYAMEELKNNFLNDKNMKGKKDFDTACCGKQKSERSRKIRESVGI
ncbi:MAG: bifunctional oligoribonuclease/PAP phosphatase NrnA [Candidatus Wallbacteria bacterium]